jgi:hypothetical protein
MYRVIIISVLTLLTLSSAARYTAKSGSRDDIQAALNLAKSGDSVMIPAGNFVFNGGATLNGGITIMGAGKDKTTLRRTTSGDSWMFTVNCSNGGKFVLTGLTIIGLSPNMSPGIKLSNNCKDFRIYDNSFRKCMDRAIEIYGNTRGVIDHNEFIDNNLTAIVIFGDGNEAWKRPLDLGSAEGIYIEDNFFRQEVIASSNMHHHVASNNGSRYVFRYNKCDDGNLTSSAVDAHGQKFYWPRGSRRYEVYGNTFNAKRRWVSMNMRGGDGVIFNNVFTGSYSYPIRLIHEGNAGDGNCTYPCVDQIRQLYIWDNTYNGKGFEVFSEHPQIVKLNRDYFVKQMTGYVPYMYPHPLTFSGDKPTGLKVNTVGNLNKNVTISSHINSVSRKTTIEGTVGEQFYGHNLMFNLYDTQGRLVRKINSNASHNGTFHFEINNNDHSVLANGVYAIELQLGGQKISKPLIINK